MSDTDQFVFKADTSETLTLNKDASAEQTNTLVVVQLANVSEAILFTVEGRLTPEELATQMQAANLHGAILDMAHTDYGTAADLLNDPSAELLDAIGIDFTGGESREFGDGLASAQLPSHQGSPFGSTALEKHSEERAQEGETTWFQNFGQSQDTSQAAPTGRLPEGTDFGFANLGVFSGIGGEAMLEAVTSVRSNGTSVLEYSAWSEAQKRMASKDGHAMEGGEAPIGYVLIKKTTEGTTDPDTGAKTVKHQKTDYTFQLNKSESKYINHENVDKKGSGAWQEVDYKWAPLYKADEDLVKGKNSGDKFDFTTETDHGTPNKDADWTFKKHILPPEGHGDGGPTHGPIILPRWAELEAKDITGGAGDPVEVDLPDWLVAMMPEMQSRDGGLDELILTDPDHAAYSAQDLANVVTRHEMNSSTGQSVMLFENHHDGPWFGGNQGPGNPPIGGQNPGDAMEYTANASEHEIPMIDPDNALLG